MFFFVVLVCLLAGNEDNAYMDNPNNCHVFSINTVCNYDKAIIPYLHAPIGSVYIRTSEVEFEIDNEDKPILIIEPKE